MLPGRYPWTVTVQANRAYEIHPLTTLADKRLLVAVEDDGIRSIELDPDVAASRPR